MRVLNTVGLGMAIVPVVFAFNQTSPSIQVHNNDSALYKPLYTLHSSSTPEFHNVSGVTVNPLIKALLGPSNSTGSLQRRDLPTGTCAPGTPCVNGACCSNARICGYSPKECGKKTCISNCDAKAECGQYGVPGNNTCPINVCCSKFGFCGTTDEFCLDGCQKHYGGCGSAQEPSCGGVTSGRTIGYYEGWSSKRSCDSRLPSDLDLTGLTHINFAFAYFDPTTFQVTPMDPDDMKLYPQFTELKKQKSSLRTWISIGGWSFNDPTNTPNTQKAFSDMASTAANRKTFIDSVLQFMTTWGFDGVDLDWEYPGAPDRGGINADTANFVALLRDMRAAFGNLYGISCTVPASFWYLRWFDIKGMEQYLDFFNVMTYDIHGVWDSTNKFTGPYVRPHTNLTEIRQGLDLLWRNNVNPANVNMGLGWYGRSFTLSDPSCNRPGCVFSSGGNPGECTKSAGTLSNAEILRIIHTKGLTPEMDSVAGVKWVSWGNQWVSYDDGETIALKIDAANRWCLGGKLIWAIDQDDTAHSSNRDLLGIGPSNGISAEVAAAMKAAQQQAEIQATVRNSCYWSFCGGSCAQGYFPETTAKGQVLGISRHTVCTGDEYQTLCCAPGTNTGTCSWEGWRGVGLSCMQGGCSDSSSSLVAMNTNQFVLNSDLNINLTCSGGSQYYCCTGFVPSPKFTTSDLVLVGQNGVSKRAWGSGKNPACIAAVTATIGLTSGLLAFFTAGISLAAAAVVIAVGIASCPTTGSGSAAGAAIGVIPILPIPVGVLPKGGKPSKPKQPTAGKPGKGIKYGQWAPKAAYGKKDKDCAVTYTCRYGLGWDEICDNQRWAIDKVIISTTFHIDRRGGRSSKDEWPSWRREEFRTLAQVAVNRVHRCQVDEFPMGVLLEAKAPNPQVVRLVNGPANGAQGVDFKQWKAATWVPCSALRKAHKKPPPPVTWEFGPFAANDNRGIPGTGKHFIQEYGVTTFSAYTFNTHSYKVFHELSTVYDHGFRALLDDPMFDAPYDWPRQRYDVDPYYTDSPPEDVASAAYLKRSNAQSALESKIPVEFANADFSVIDRLDAYLTGRELEQLMDLESYYDTPPPPEPTQSEKSLNEADVTPSLTGADMATQAAAVPLDLPVETGRVAAHVHAHGSRRSW
ncbi:glycoside hydrolase [Mollisia scopiformis]|uniref:chitinase n=1 Tax=Mollisia scopiformis TaxID=149040 RepID=A0A194WZZ0_MOLSC|nr:glycoside hydrolase [Mollisia scopiformis]KUJ13269.1 glycoside hydrolase [Mollisia scopiformis]